MNKNKKSTSHKGSYTSGHGLDLGSRSECIPGIRGLMWPSSPLELDKTLFENVRTMGLSFSQIS